MHYTDADGLTSRTVRALMVDREGNVWVGTTQGLDRFSEPSLESPAAGGGKREGRPPNR